ncbi:inositol monophosphatase [Leptospira yasudae]|uniref:inositol monophosphatase family protein n=1 Tax=Leptospira yasudae TaxID=2202201 RepID=UPI001C50074E|nr:inositol monophosphatase family protein [Leptospira yasudae]MBW0434127.1 inositol monophosphatase [Leptospira yasudae]
MNTTHKKTFLVKAAKIAEEVGKKLKKRNASLLKVNSSKAHDIKIQADLEAENKIIKYLRKNSDFSILSEESKEIYKTKHSEHGSIQWIIDPLDGTLNFLKGIPMCSVSIGLWNDDSPILGAVYDIFREDLYSGIANKGAWKNKNKIQVSGIRKFSDAVLCTGVPVKSSFSAQNLQNFVTDFQNYKKVRLFGSASLSLCMVASGAVEVYKENDIQVWDVAGAIPIVLGAGGKVQKIKTDKDTHTYDVCASNGNVPILKS